MGRYARLLFLAAVALLTACENDFSPKTDIVSKVAVFCILDASQPYQSVVLARSYDADLGVTLQPLTSKEVAEADVRIYGGGQTYVFTDTLVDVDGGGQRHAWINRDLRPVPEVTYRLQVTVPNEEKLTGTVTVPSKIYVRAEYVRADTGRGTVHVHPGATSFTVPADAYYYRTWSETWKKQPAGDTLITRLEIPLYYRGGWIYSAPARQEEIVFLPGIIEQFKEANEAPGDSVLARKFIVQGYAMDRQFYSYYKIARGFDDPLSVRLDLPDLSFVEGGLGVFGAMVADSSTYSIYSFIR